jgi:hypothetical protein
VESPVLYVRQYVPPGTSRLAQQLSLFAPQLVIPSPPGAQLGFDSPVVEPEQAPAEHSPVAHVQGLPHAPSAEYISTWVALAHCVDGVVGSHCPFELHVCAPFSEHCVAPGTHTSASACAVPSIPASAKVASCPASAELPLDDPLLDELPLDDPEEPPEELLPDDPLLEDPLLDDPELEPLLDPELPEPLLDPELPLDPDPLPPLEDGAASPLPPPGVELLKQPPEKPTATANADSRQADRLFFVVVAIFVGAPANDAGERGEGCGVNGR